MSKAQILVVDADVNQLRAVSHGLEAEGFRVLAAKSADEALELAERYGADAALVELRLPGTHGLDLTRALRAIDGDMVVLLTSAFELSKRQLERCDCGAVGFLRKPAALATVASELRRSLEGVTGPASATRWCAAPVNAALA